MKVMSIVCYTLSAILAVFLVIAAFKVWNDFLGVGGILISIFLLPFAVLASPIVDGFNGGGFWVILTDYIYIGGILGLYSLGHWLDEKHKAKEYQKTFKS